MEPQAIRVTIELPQGTDVQTSVGATGETAGPGGSAHGGIDAGPPPSALVAALGDPHGPAATEATDTMTGSPSGEAISAGAFPERLATAMEAEGPRHPFGSPDSGLATTMAPILGPESRN